MDDCGFAGVSGICYIQAVNQRKPKHEQIPVAMRYGWSDVPTVNLYNAAGLPAIPFRTDDWEGVTEKNSFVPADQI